MTAIADVIGELVQQSIARDVQRRDDNDLVVRKIGTIGKNEINTYVVLIERVVHLSQLRPVILAVAELHELNSPVGVGTVENGHWMGALEIDNLRSNVQEFVGGTA